MKGGTLDIETFPGIYRSFANNFYEAGLMQEVQPVLPASFSFKPYKKGPTITKGVWEYETTEAFLWDLWKIFDENDFIIGHFVKNFDHRQSNTFFAQFGLSAPSKTNFYCTKEITKKHFKLPSYKLKYCLKFFGIGYKMETGGDQLWFETELGDPKARAKMLRYNRNDTVQTEKLFIFLVENGWTDAPGSKYYTKESGCPRCGSHDMESRGEKPSKEGWRRQYCCRTCGKRPMDASVVRPWPALSRGVGIPSTS